MSTPIWYEYDKITDDLLWIGNGGIIRMVVQLSSPDKNGMRTSFHHEYAYTKNQDNLSSISRKYNFFLTINKTYDKEYVMITANEILLIRAHLERVEKWFQSGTFGIKNDELYIQRKKEPIVIDGLLEKKWLAFNPIIIVRENQVQIMGVRLNLYDSCFIDIPIDNFYGMKYLFDTIDMFSMASNMVNYLGRPDFGTNQTSFRNDETPSNQGGRFFK
ncbi:MAG: hypothetical protein PHC62_00420 [Candidatus Izemoplasmatales bacterium]|nr:hypothetical protein [Candidatus Izemoplasmatales bacterium]